jgi:hypothetical protein
MADGSRSADESTPGQLAQHLPGFDPSSVIADVERGLVDFLNKPIQQTLNLLPLQRFPEQPTADPEGSASPIDPFQLISTVVGALGTLGSGLFSGLDPTRILKGVSDAFDGVAAPLQRALGAVAHDWQGGSGSAVDAKTRAAVANGADLATQADGLRENLSTAVSDVAQARMRMIDIIDEFQAKMAVTDVTTPSGRSAAIAAANQAHKDSTAVMKELQARLGAQAEKVSADGAPAGVTKAPEAGATAIARPAHKPANRRPDVAKIPVSKVQYKRHDFAKGKAAYQKYIAKTLDTMGVTDPKARRNWTTGLLTAASRESSFNPVAVNKWDSNAHGPTRSDGAPAHSSRGGLQTIPTTFAAYHQAGTSTNIYDPVANAAAAMNYVMDRYDVDRDGSNLSKVSQFDPHNKNHHGY